MQNIFKDFKVWSTRFALFTATFVFFSTLILGTMTAQKINAQTKVLLSPSEHAIKYQVMQFLKVCGDNKGWHSSQGAGTRSEGLSAEELNQGRFFDDEIKDSTIFGNEISVGALTDDDDGNFNCLVKQGTPAVVVNQQYDVQKAVQYQQEDLIKFLVESNVYRVGENGRYYLHDEEDSDRSNKVIEYFKNNNQGYSFDGDLPDSAKYFNWKASYLKFCAEGGKPIDSGSIELPNVGEDGKRQNDKFQIKSDAAGNKSVGRGMGQGDRDEFSCNEIADGMRATADAAVKGVEDYVKAGGKVKPNPNAPGTADDDSPTCESSGGITWVICPFINGLAELADGAFEKLIIPLLKTSPVDTTNTSSPIFQVWLGMRNVANILLVIAMIVIVFGQAIGGGLVDAYTAKKVLPRILAAAIMINLSIYMVAFAVDVTNVIGQGLSRLIYAPFDQVGAFKFNLSSSTAGLGFVGMIAASAAIWKIGALIPYLLLFVLLPLVLAAVGVIFTLVLRMGLIQFLIISSPVAFVLYCLPNTEKYFQKWWSLFIKTLMVYPIIVLIFTLADVIAVTTDIAAQESDQEVTAAFGQLISVVLLVLPLFMVPYAFKLAGGAVGAVHGALSTGGKKSVEAIKGNPNDPNSLRNRTKRNVGSSMVKNRAQLVRSNLDYKGTGLNARLRRKFGEKVNYGNIMDKEAEINEDAAKRMGRTIGAGDDRYIRARTSLPLFQKAGGGETTNTAEAVMDTSGTALRLLNKDTGQAMRTSLNGQKRFTDVDYKKSTQLFQTMGEMQEAVNHEAKKTLTDGDTDRLVGGYGDWAKQEGLTKEQASGLFTGVAFARQGERLELKHSTVDEEIDPDDPKKRRLFVKSATDNMSGTSIDSTGTVNKIGGRDAFVQELYDKKGSWAVSQMHDSTINQVGEAKEKYAAEIKDLSSRESLGTLSEQELGRLKLSREKLDHIQEMEESWVADPTRTATGIPMGAVDDKGTPGYSGLSGAAAGVLAAAKRSALTTQLGADGKTYTVRKIYDNKGNLVPQNVRGAAMPPRGPLSPGGPGVTSF